MAPEEEPGWGAGREEGWLFLLFKTKSYCIKTHLKQNKTQHLPYLVLTYTTHWRPS